MEEPGGWSRETAIGALPAVCCRVISRDCRARGYTARRGKPSIELADRTYGAYCRRADDAGGLHRLSEPSYKFPAAACALSPGCGSSLHAPGAFTRPAELLALQYRAIERLLTADVFELRYTDLNWAVDRLRALVREGR